MHAFAAARPGLTVGAIYVTFLALAVCVTALALSAGLNAGPAALFAAAGAAGIALAGGARGGGVDRARELIATGLILLAVALTNVGTAIVTNRMIQAGTAPKNIGWGTGTNAAAVTDTALQTEAAPTTSGGRTVGTESRATTTVTNDTYRVVGTVTAGGTLAITEAGLFDAVSAGVIFLRAVFSSVGVGANDSIQFTFDTKIGASVT